MSHVLHKLRAGLNAIFELKNPLVEYTPNKEDKVCSDLECVEKQACWCSLCVCCSVCCSKCTCSEAKSDPNQKLEELLGFGDEKYRCIHAFIYKNYIYKNY